MSKNRSLTLKIFLKMMNSTSLGMSSLLALMQTFKVLLTIFSGLLQRPQPQPFESLSLKTPAKSVPTTPSTALQQKIKPKLEKSLGSQLNTQLQQQMAVFQASMSQAMQSLRDDFQFLKKTSSKSEVEED